MAKLESDLDILRSYLEAVCVHIDDSYHLDKWDVYSDKLPPTSDEEEQCARITDRLGFDGNIFRNLSVRETGADLTRRLIRRRETLPRIIAKLEEHEKAKLESPEEPKHTLVEPKQTLTQGSLEILQYLKTQKVGRKQSEIEANTGFSRGTVGERLKELREAGLIHRPHGPRKGEAITQAGKEYLEDD